MKQARMQRRQHPHESFWSPQPAGDTDWINKTA
jgi:hypothetical protein